MESDFGIHKVFKHRYITVAADQASLVSGAPAQSNSDLVGIENARWYVAFLRTPVHVPLAKTGSATKGMIEGELTLEARAEKSSFLTQDLT